MPSITMQRIPVRTGSNDREGWLVLFDGELVAVLVRLDDEMHGGGRGQWFVEAAFGPNLTPSASFSTLAEVEAWVNEKLAG